MPENKDIILASDPWALFRDWYADAKAHEPNDPNAMGLATVGPEGMPSLRVVLMKGFDESGFTFFTNRESQKGHQLAELPKAALCWHWKSLRRQIRSQGHVVPVSDADADAYFATRPRQSQIGAWASQQSRPLSSRALLENRVKEIDALYLGKPVPRPAYWGGYHLTPLRVEFWQDRPFRLHDRIVYARHQEQAAWDVERLYP